MPNWCANNVEISHDDTSKLEALAAAIRGGSFCNFIKPVPEELKQDGWYDFCVNNWGTKWDVEPYQGDNVQVVDNSISFGFDSAWSPPIGIYEALQEQGFIVRAFYYEPGVGFVGEWDDGDDYCFDYTSCTSETVRDLIGETLDDMFSISEEMAHYEDEEIE